MLATGLISFAVVTVLTTCPTMLAVKGSACWMGFYPLLLLLLPGLPALLLPGFWTCCLRERPFLRSPRSLLAWIPADCMDSVYWFQRGIAKGDMVLRGGKQARISIWPYEGWSTGFAEGLARGVQCWGGVLSRLLYLWGVVDHPGP